MTDTFRVAAGYVLPHPPVIVPGVNHGPHLADATVAAMRNLADDLALIQPDTIVILSPHAPLFSDYLFMYDNSELAGNLGRFGAPQASLSFRQDTPLHREITRRLEQAGIPAGGLTSTQMRQHQIDPSLDHGVMVPLWFMREKNQNFELVAMSCSNLPLPQLYQVGEVIRQAAASLKRKIVIIASGDQSHKVNDESPYGAVPEGAIFDNLLTDCLRKSDLPRLLAIDGHLRERAAECGYRSLVILCGAFNRQAVLTSLESYEAPYGIGYCVAAIRPDDRHPEPVDDAMEAGLKQQREHNKAGRQHNQPPVIVARETLEAYIRNHRHKTSQDFKDLKNAEFLFSDRAGVFVSLKKFGDLRGCIGTTAPTTASLADEIIQNAISAGTQDPRFNPVTADELDDLVYSVDVLGEPEPIKDRRELDPAVYGVIVRSGGRSGLLLPALEGVETVEEQLAIACRKAGISHDENYSIQRFKVKRYV